MQRTFDLVNNLIIETTPDVNQFTMQGRLDRIAEIDILIIQENNNHTARIAAFNADKQNEQDRYDAGIAAGLV